MKVAIHQPNFIPWFGFFYKMAQSDSFVFLDTVKHSKSSVTHRNKIIINGKPNWITVPLSNKEDLISELSISDYEQNLISIFNRLDENLKESKYWNSDLKPTFFNFFVENPTKMLIDLNLKIINHLADYLEIDVTTHKASNLKTQIRKGSNGNLDICKYLNANCYISGLGGKKYNDENSFLINNIEISYSKPPTLSYFQFNSEEFIPNLSIIDVICNLGKKTIEYLDK